MKIKKSILLHFFLSLSFYFHASAIDPITVIVGAPTAAATATTTTSTIAAQTSISNTIATTASEAFFQAAVPEFTRLYTVYKGLKYLRDNKLFIPQIRKFWSSSRGEMFYHKHCASWNMQDYHKAFAQELGTVVERSDYDGGAQSQFIRREVVFDIAAQNKIFEQYSLYHKTAFREFLKSLPDFDNQITIVYQNYKSGNISGWRRKKCLGSHIENLYRPVQIKREQEIAAQNARMQAEADRLAALQERQRIIVSNLNQDAEQLYELYDDYQEYILDSDADTQINRITDRSVAFEAVFSKSERYYQKSYRVSHDAKSFSTTHGIDSTILTSCYGNQIQQELHQEFVDIVEQAAKTWLIEGDIKPVEVMADILADFVQAGIGYNKIGAVSKATTIADCCWALVQGVGDGIKNTGHAILHPIETGIGIAHGIGAAGHYLGKAVYEIADMSHLVLIDSDGAIEKLEAWSKNVDTVYQAIKLKYDNSTLPEIIRGTTAFATESVLVSRFFTGVGKLFKYAKANKAKYIQQLKDAVKARPVALTAEGIPVQVTENAIEYMKNTAKQVGAAVSKSDANEILKKMFIDLKKSNVIKQFNIIQKMDWHVFSDQHLRDCIMSLGRNKMEILNKLANIIIEADYKGLVKAGPNQIYTTINGYKTTIRFFVQDGRVQMMNGFLNHAVKKIGNTFNLIVNNL